MSLFSPFSLFFFFNDTATTEIYTLSLHDALPIYLEHAVRRRQLIAAVQRLRVLPAAGRHHVHERHVRSEEHTSELQSQSNLVCRLLLEKKKKKEQYRSFFAYVRVVVKAIPSAPCH